MGEYSVNIGGREAVVVLAFVAIVAVVVIVVGVVGAEAEVV